MIVKNVYIENIDYFLEDIIRRLITNNISYVLIKEELYIELHFDKYIYKFYSNMYFDFNAAFVNKDSIYKDMFNIIEINISNEQTKYADSLITYKKVPKERPGFKRYTKKDIKRDKYNYKTSRKR